MSISKRLIALPIATLLMATASIADDKPNYGHSGLYLGVGGGVAFDFLSDFVESKTAGIVDLTSGGSFNARLGYRLTSWFATELMYEGNYNSGVELLGVEAAQFSSHSVLANLKFLLPIWRIHPYLSLGIGAQYGDFDGFDVLPPPFDLNRLDTTRWDVVLRVGVGIDAYITDHWLVNVDLAPSIRFTDYGNIPSQSTDNVAMTLSGGVQYRF